MSELVIELESEVVGFESFDLSPPILQALAAAGYATPTPIQAGTIPHLLAGRDVLGQAQTGTGKTAAFGLPLLSNVDVKDRRPQVIVLAPTRELALQVAEEFRKFGACLPGLNVLPIFGGAAYDPQIASLRRGAQVVVGTPGRVMDHLRRGTLQLDAIRALVLDEADEMLKMGFVEDVEWILQHTPEQRQVALFSATMPPAIRDIAHRHLKNPETVSISSRQTGAETIDQRMLVVGFHNKFDALCRILEAEPTEGVIIFVKTKMATIELSENVAARGFSAAALNGDMPQTQRQRMVEQFKSGRINVLVATDVAARGLDVDRVSHVINYDLPRDSEAYVHRIGRTGRAGRDGAAIMLVTPRERGFAATIQRATRQPLTTMEVPTVEQINARRVASFKSRVTAALASESLNSLSSIVDSIVAESGESAVRVAAALAKLAMGDQGLLPVDSRRSAPRSESNRSEQQRSESNRSEFNRSDFSRTESGRSESNRSFDTNDSARANPDGSRRERKQKRMEVVASPDQQLEALVNRIRENREPEFSFEPSNEVSDAPRAKRGATETRWMDRYRIAVGRQHGVLPGNLVGAITSEAGLEGRDVGRIEIMEDHSFVDLPQGMPGEIFSALSKTWVAGQQLQLTKVEGGIQIPGRPGKPAAPFHAGKSGGKGKPAHGGKSFGGKSFAGKAKGKLGAKPGLKKIKAKKAKAKNA